jgi:protein O-mannosyl-transferase
MDRRVFVPILIVIAVLAVYWPVIGYPFVDFDDPDYVRDNVLVKAGLTGETIVWAFTTDSLANWHPLTWLSLMLDAHITRSIGWDPANPTIYHITNLLLHAANAVLLLNLLARMTGAFWCSAAVATLFALHPVHVESVAWVSERKDVLSMFFMLLAIRFYVNYVRYGEWQLYAWAALFLALGLMTKAMLVTLPFVLLLLDFWPLQRLRFGDTAPSPQSREFESSQKRSIIVLEKLPLLAIAIASSAITYWVQLGSKQLEDGQWISLSSRLANVAVSYVRYLGTLFWPADLAALYPNPSAIGKPFWETWQVVGALGCLAAVTVSAIVLSRKRPYFAVGWFWFLGTMVPVIGIVQIGRHSMADRYAYIPFIGLYIIIAWGIADLTKRWSLRAIPLATIAAIALVALAVVTRYQISFWRNSTALFERAISVTKENWLMHHNYAVMLSRAGEKDEAMKELDIAMTIYPDCWWMHSYRGVLLLREEKFYDAQQCFEKALTYRPEDFELLHSLGVVLTKRKQLSQAVDAFRRSLVSQPNYFESRKSLAITVSSLGDRAEAQRIIEEGIKLDPKREKEYRELLMMIN